MGRDGHLLSECTFQFILLLVGFLELSKDCGEEVFEVGQQVRLVLLQLQPQLPDITFTVREGETLAGLLGKTWGLQMGEGRQLGTFSSSP